MNSQGFAQVRKNFALKVPALVSENAVWASIMSNNLIQHDPRDGGCRLIRHWENFHPFTEMICDNKDIEVTLRGLREGSKNVSSQSVHYTKKLCR